MKKVGLLLLALVLALGALGVGYARWQDSVVINGTVNTGTVTLTVLPDTSATYVYKDTSNDTVNVSGVKLTDPKFILVASANATRVSDDQVLVAFDNLFPIFAGPGPMENPIPYCADFTVKYTGTIPVHCKAEMLTNTLAGLNNYFSFVYIYKGQIIDPSSIQLHNGDELNVKICVVIPETGPNTPALQGLSGSFSAQFIAWQWNEQYP